MRAALVQMTSSDVPGENLQVLQGYVAEAAQGGADLVVTPEVSNCVSTSRSHQNAVLQLEADDQTLRGLQDAARTHATTVLVGSLALKTGDPDGRFANRSFLIDPAGDIRARYDKMHMFDVTLSEAESYRESAGYRPGGKAVLVAAAGAKIGLTICYDLRFPYLYRALAKAGAQVLTIPSAFSVPTGQAHWETLLRARAIETGCFVLAPAQTGTHSSSAGKPRRTYGHSMAVSPWGEVLLDAGLETGVSFVDLDLSLVDDARRRIPSLSHDQNFTGPT